MNANRLLLFFAILMVSIISKTAEARFLTEDPLGHAAGVNFYVYVNNNPVNATDPKGLWPVFATDPTEEEIANARNKLKRYVPDLEANEIKTIVNDVIDEVGSFDIPVALATFSDVLYDPPKSLTDLSTDQKNYIYKFLDRLPNRNQSAIKKIRSSCPQ